MGSYDPFTADYTDCFPATRRGTCFYVPPPGQLNSNGQTAEEALAACKERCDRNTNQCKSIVVVPGTMPAAVSPVEAGTTTNIPWGVGSCKESCLSAEPEGTSVCYGLRGIANKNVEEEWTVVERDAEDEIFYSTCYRRIPGYDFGGVRCGEECYGGGGSGQPAPWRFEERCVTCEVAARNADGVSVPFWELAPPDQCVACHRAEVGPPLPAPPPYPTSLPAAGRRFVATTAAATARVDVWHLRLRRRLVLLRSALHRRRGLRMPARAGLGCERLGPSRRRLCHGEPAVRTRHP